MPATQSTLTPGAHSTDVLNRSKVDAQIWKLYIDTRASFNKCTTDYAAEWALDLYPKDSTYGGPTGSVKYRHKACGGLHAVEPR
jgi:hypothetical protein